MNWNKIATLRGADWALLAEAAWAVGWANVKIRGRPLETGALGGISQATRQTDEALFARVAWAVRALARRMPGRNACLVQAIAARDMLQRRGYAVTLRIGVAGRDPAGKIKAHAWVEHGGQVVIGDLHDLSTYSVLSSPGTT